jgi:hypothetical protein
MRETWHTAMQKVAGFRWEIAHEAVSRRPPIPLDTVVARTEGYTHAANVWALSLVPGPFSVAPCAKPYCYDSQLLHRRMTELAGGKYEKEET